MLTVSAVIESLNCKYFAVSESSTSTGISTESKWYTSHTRTRSPKNCPCLLSRAPWIWYTYLFIHIIIQRTRGCRPSSANKAGLSRVDRVARLISLFPYFIYFFFKKNLKKSKKACLPCTPCHSSDFSAPTYYM